MDTLAKMEAQFLHQSGVLLGAAKRGIADMMSGLYRPILINAYPR
ncbi:MAG: hypothetical protein COB61_006120 [Thiotrichales bacterium]|nr:hypothetical protein [Thiotrichales bacterium]